MHICQGHAHERRLSEGFQHLRFGHLITEGEGRVYIRNFTKVDRVPGLNRGKVLVRTLPEVS